MSDDDLIRRGDALAIVVRDRVPTNRTGSEFRVVSTQDMLKAIAALPAEADRDALSEHPTVKALLAEERALMMDALGALVSARVTIRRKWGTTNPERERVISALCKALDVNVVPAAALKGDDHE